MVGILREADKDPVAQVARECPENCVNALG